MKLKLKSQSKRLTVTGPTQFCFCVLFFGGACRPRCRGPDASLSSSLCFFSQVKLFSHGGNLACFPKWKTGLRGANGNGSHTQGEPSGVPSSQQQNCNGERDAFFFFLSQPQPSSLPPPQSPPPSFLLLLLLRIRKHNSHTLNCRAGTRQPAGS